MEAPCRVFMLTLHLTTTYEADSQCMGVRWLDSTTRETNILPVGRFQSRSKKPKSNCGGAKYWFGDFSHPMLPIFVKDDSYCVRTTVRILPPTRKGSPLLIILAAYRVSLPYRFCTMWPSELVNSSRGHNCFVNVDSFCLFVLVFRSRGPKYGPQNHKSA